MTDLVKKGYSPKNVGQDADYIALKNAKNAFNWQGIWQINDVNALPRSSRRWPRCPRSATKGGVWGNSHQFVLPRNERHRPEQVGAPRYFINWFSQNERGMGQERQGPGRRRASPRARSSSSSTDLEPFAAEVPDVHFPPAVAGIGDAHTEAVQRGQQRGAGQGRPGGALTQRGQQGDPDPAANKKKYG